MQHERQNDTVKRTVPMGDGLAVIHNDGNFSGGVINNINAGNFCLVMISHSAAKVAVATTDIQNLIALFDQITYCPEAIPNLIFLGASLNLDKPF